ncbi:hypothetical protein DYB32_001851 [Aphanomyces invadans]|uniref:phenylalanine 4-monooxygenase n=1 Tax=Aphanomyces invadans TaxID=157072 RepID=A0A3R6Z8F1_9STRA|nr:hypothetical protein DYB32_001851 [Aphanomyces invadans]
MALHMTTARLISAAKSARVLRQTSRLTTATLPSIVRSKIMPRALSSPFKPHTVSPAALFVRAYSQPAVARGLEKPKTSLLLETNDGPGSLQEVLKFFWKHDVNMVHIESRPTKGPAHDYAFFIDFDGRPGEPAVDLLLEDLRRHCSKIMVLNDKKGWSSTMLWVKTWGVVYDRMEDMWAKYACDEFKYILPLLETNCGYSRDNIPQAQDISDFLKECTGASSMEVAIVGQTLCGRVHVASRGRSALGARFPERARDPDFADFSHEIGLASLGASDEEIERLATCYWFSVEFGVCMQNGEKKAYGAGLLSSFGELEYACSPTRPAGGEDAFPEYRPWNPFEAAKQKYPITTYQPIYYVADSLADAKARMREFTEDMKKPFYARYNPYQQTICVDRAVSVESKKIY